MSFTLTYQTAINFLSWLRVKTLAGPGELQLLCLQGATNNNGLVTPVPNQPNIYNDLICYVHDKTVEIFTGTVDPGAGPAVNREGGQAHLVHGQHFYVPGTHNGKPAFRALNELNRVWRDLDKNHVFSPGDYLSQGAYGVNIHWGGNGPQIYNWSEGCINICGGEEGAPWKRLKELAAIHFKTQKTLPVTIWTASDLQRFADKGWDIKPTLRYGLNNPWVGELQALLASKGYFTGSIDSDWQGRTQISVLGFQKAKGLAQDGIVGQHTWDTLKNS